MSTTSKTDSEFSRGSWYSSWGSVFREIYLTSFSAAGKENIKFSKKMLVQTLLFAFKIRIPPEQIN